MEKNVRTKKIACQIKREISLIVQKDLSDPALKMMTIGDVLVSKDLANAKVFVSLLQGKPASQEEVDSQISILNKASNYIRCLLFERLPMRVVPKITFYYDKLLDDAWKLTNIKMTEH